MHFLPQLTDRTHALVLGDGDGRFLAALLQQNPTLTSDAVDTSAPMLKLLRLRCERIAPNASSRLKVHQADALNYLSAAPPRTYDLVVTHFFLDCLTQNEVDALATNVSARVIPEAVWLISDFRVPPGVMRLPAQLIVRSLYLAFRMTTGLRTRQLPDHSLAVTQAGFTCIAQSLSLFGILTTELWTRAPLTEPAGL